jgi:hypothetical protein
MARSADQSSGASDAALPSSQFGGDASAVAANTPKPAAKVTPPTPPAPAANPAPATPPATTGFTQADIDKAVAAATATQKTTDANNVAAVKAASITDAATQGAAVLSGYGLTGDIANGIVAMMQNGLDMTTITNVIDSSDPMTAVKGLGLSDTQLSAATNLVSAWQTRFSGNQARIAAGLQPLDPATYIQNENSYKQVMTMAGIPNSSPLMATQYLGNLMAMDVSPAEIKMRVDTATAAIQNEDPQVIQQLQSQYGLSTASLMTHLLDPKVAAPVIQQEYNAATIGAEAARANANIAYGGTGPLSAMSLAAQGISQAQAAQGFQQIAGQTPALQTLAGRYTGYGTAGNVAGQLGAATFGTAGAAQAEAEITRLRAQESASFSGSAGASKGSLLGAQEGVS